MTVEPVVGGLDLADELDLHAAPAVTVKRHGLWRFVIHDGPLDPVGHALDFDDRLDDRALLQGVRQFAPPHPVDASAIPCSAIDRRRTPTPSPAATERRRRRRVWPSPTTWAGPSGVAAAAEFPVAVGAAEPGPTAGSEAPARSGRRCLVHGLLGRILHLVDVLGVLALRLLVDDVTGLVDRGVHLVGVLGQQTLDLV